MRIALSRQTWSVLLFVVLGTTSAFGAECPSELGVPGVSPTGGLFQTSPVTVTMTGASADPNIIIMFSTNGGPPVPFYSQPLQLTATTTVKAQLRCRQPWGEYVYGGIVTHDFVLRVGTPVVSLAGGTYDPGTVVTVSTETPGALLRYRVDGQAPTDSDPIVPPDGRLFVPAATLTVRGFSGDMDPSDVVTRTYSLAWSYNHGAVATGWDFSAALRPDGTVWTWGTNTRRQFGYGERRNGTSGELVLTQSGVPANSGVTGVTAIAAANHAVFALRADGTVWTWGDKGGTTYVLGRSTCDLPYQSVYYCVRPESIGLTNVVGVAAGSYHGLALDRDGFVWSWGYNNKGQLGDDTLTNRWQPQIVSGLTNVVEIAAANTMSYARTSDGTVWAWGNPRLGNGSGSWIATPIKTPVPVPGLPAGITRIWAGYGNGYARGADGLLWVWGEYSSGQLGFGTNQGTPNFMPAAHTSLGGVRSASGGEQHSTLVLEDGGGRSMGANLSGQLGDGTMTQRLSPTPVAAVPALRRVVAGWKHNLAIGQDHSGWAWGLNSDWQIGNDSTTNVLTPVQILPVGFFDGCQAQVTPATVVVPSSGGPQVFDVKVAWDCEWALTSDSAWAHPGPAGVGVGSATVTVDVNPGPERTAMLTIAGKAVTVTQQGFAIVPPVNEEISYFHTDAVGSVRMITSATGAVLARYDYLPFGTEWTTSFSTTTNNVKFTGQERDPETANGGWAAQDYFGARAFQSQTGRFTRADDLGFGDPFNPQSMNMYAYAYNNPLRWIDPTGHEGDCVTAYDPAAHSCKPDGAWEMARRFFRDSWISLSSQLAAARERVKQDYPRLDQVPVMGASPFGPPLGRLGGVIGRSFGHAGKVVANPGIAIRGFRGSVVAGHPINQIINRGVSPKLLQSIVRNPVVVLEQGGGRYLYLSGRGAVVMTGDGQVVTAWTAGEFLPHIWHVLRTVGQ